MNSSSSSIPFDITRKTDSFNNGKYKEHQINIDITPKKKSNPSSPLSSSMQERKIIIDIQKKTEFVNIQTNTPRHEPTPQPYRASPFRKDRLNYSEYTNPKRSPNSSNMYSSNNSNKTPKNRSVQLSSSTVAELSEDNYHTFDPITPKASSAKRKRNQLPQTEPRPKLRAFHHFTPPRYEPRPPSNGKTYISQLSEDSGSSVFIDSSAALLSEKEEEENAEKYSYYSSEEILPIKRTPRYHFIMSSSDLTAFSEEQNSSSGSERRNKSRSINANPNKNYSSSYYSERNPVNESSYEYSNRSHRSRHDRHSYGQAPSESSSHSHSHVSHQSRHQDKNSSENIKVRRNMEDDQPSRTSKDSKHNIAQTPAQPRYTIHGSRRSPPKTQPTKRDIKSRNANLEESISENHANDRKHHSKQVYSNTSQPTENHKHRSRTKSNVSNSKMIKSGHSHSHHSRSDRKSEPYYVLMKFTNSDGLAEIESEDFQYASTIHQTTKEVNQIFSFQDTHNYYASLDPSELEKQEIYQNHNNNENSFNDEEEPDFDFCENIKEESNKTKKQEIDEEEEIKEPKSKKKANQLSSSSKAKKQSESGRNGDEKFEEEEEEINEVSNNSNNSNIENDEDFQKLVEIPVQDRSIELSNQSKSKKSDNYQPMQTGLIDQIESNLTQTPSIKTRQIIPSNISDKSDKSDSHQEAQKGLIEKIENQLKPQPKEDESEHSSQHHSSSKKAIPIEDPFEMHSDHKHRKLKYGLIEKVENQVNKPKERGFEIDLDKSQSNKEQSGTENEGQSQTEKDEYESHTEKEPHSRSEAEEDSQTEKEQHSRSEAEEDSQTEKEQHSRSEAEEDSQTEKEQHSRSEAEEDSQNESVNPSSSRNKNDSQIVDESGSNIPSSARSNGTSNRNDDEESENDSEIGKLLEEIGSNKQNDGEPYSEDD